MSAVDATPSPLWLNVASRFTQTTKQYTMSLSRSRSRSRSSYLSSIAPTLVQESPVECPDTLLKDSEVDEDTLFYPPQAGDHEEMPKSKPQADVQDIQPQADIQTASSSGDAPALVEKPSDARSCGDAFAPPQGCSQALVEKPSDARSCGDA